tara:strand:- start:49841 stop:50236 length:396 start_codon:yes stop_codon:yes gene_type:complete
VRGFAVALLAALSLVGCASVPTCGPGERAGESAQLFFGRNIGPTLGVDEAAFQDFVAREISPRFPSGMTILDAEGRWASQGQVMTEAAKVVVLVQAGTIERSALSEIRAAYRDRFLQEAVLQLTAPVCLTF